jgi:hypothetical protein
MHMTRNCLILGLLVLISSPCLAKIDVTALISEREALMRGKTSYSQIEIDVITPRWKRKMKMEAWSEGTKKSFIRIQYPIRDKGVTFLKIENDMWQYIPKIERIIKFPPSMMLQSWMGTDFSNDDLVKESSILDDYDHQLVIEDKKTAVIEFIPKEDAPVVWGKIVSKMYKDNLMPIYDEYYDEDNELIRTIQYSNYMKLKDRFYPGTWEVIPAEEDKAGYKTIMTMTNIEFDKPLKKNIFSLKSLKRLSR